MSSPLTTWSCQYCGANLSLDQLRGTDCPYCRSAFPHHARAVEHAALVHQVMAQNMVHLAATLPAPYLPAVHIDAGAVRRMNNGIAATVFVAIAVSVAFTIACAVMFA